MRRPPNTRHRTSSRGRTNKRDRKERKSEAAPEPGPPPYRHPFLGDIPRIYVTRVDAKGNEYRTLDFDPTFSPPLPPGAVRGDVKKQHFCGMCHTPRYYYQDVEKVCVQCGEPFAFTGSEQKYWYETLQFHFDSVATRCRTCRKKRRSDQALRAELAEASARAEAEPAQPAALIGLAEAIVHYFERYQQGSLAKAIAVCRKARRANKSGHSQRELAAAIYWEATAHSLAGRAGEAARLYTEFVDTRPGGGRLLALAKQAEKWLAAHAT